MQINTTKTAPNLQAYICGNIAEKRHNQGQRFIQTGFDWEQLPQAVHDMGQTLYFTGFRNNQKRANELARVITHWFPNLSSDDQQTAWEIIKNKVSYRKKVDGRAQANQNSKNISRHNIKTAYVQYVRQHGKEPSKRWLVIAAKSSNRSVAAWCSEMWQKIYGGSTQTQTGSGIFYCSSQHKPIKEILELLEQCSDRFLKSDRIIPLVKRNQKATKLPSEVFPSSKTKVLIPSSKVLKKPELLSVPRAGAPIARRLNSQTVKCRCCGRKIQYIKNEAGKKLSIQALDYSMTVFYPHVLKLHKHNRKFTVQNMLDFYKQEIDEIVQSGKEIPAELSLAMSNYKGKIVSMNRKRMQRKEDQKQLEKERMQRRATLQRHYVQMTSYLWGVERW